MGSQPYGVEADRPAWAGAGAAIPDNASAPVIAKTIAVLLTTLSSSWGRCGASDANIEACCFERCLSVQLAGNLVFTEMTRQAIDHTATKSETMTFSYCCFAIGTTTSSLSRLQGVV
jgi:hypothetical protein